MSRTVRPQRVVAYHAGPRMGHTSANADTFDIVAEAEAITAEAASLALV